MFVCWALNKMCLFPTAQGTKYNCRYYHWQICKFSCVNIEVVFHNYCLWFLYRALCVRKVNRCLFWCQKKFKIFTLSYWSGYLKFSTLFIRKVSFGQKKIHIWSKWYLRKISIYAACLKSSVSFLLHRYIKWISTGVFLVEHRSSKV